jgi:hypothetical protein
MISFKGRTVNPGQQVEVYRNLNVEGHYSIRCAKSKLVLCHAESVLIKNCRFVTNEKSRQKIIETKRKLVHAYVVGEFIEADTPMPEDVQEGVYYNPYITKSFVLLQGGNVIENSRYCYANGKYVYVSSLDTGLDELRILEREIFG